MTQIYRAYCLSNINISGFQFVGKRAFRFFYPNSSYIHEKYLRTDRQRDTSSSKRTILNHALNIDTLELKESAKVSSTNSTFLKSGELSAIPFPTEPKKRDKHNVPHDSKKLYKQYLKLTKPNLTVLVTLSSICSYAISPNSLSMTELAFLTIGTAMCSGSANAINMGREPEFDRKMSRTALRPVVTGKLSLKQAYYFAALTGCAGVASLYFGVNPTVAFLGFLNIGLYGWIYTSLKRRSILNTWVGAIVGAIPPLMGWAASTTLAHPGAWCLAALLYAWQFPHFNSLSHNIAQQYKEAGYVMTASENPKLNARVALRYLILMFPICIGLSYYDVTDWVFVFDSGLANFWLTLLAFKFWYQQRLNYREGHKVSDLGVALANAQAKKLFWCSVWQLPVVLVLAMLHKKGQWEALWNMCSNTPQHKEKPLHS